jgi:hypothetical protein
VRDHGITSPPLPGSIRCPRAQDPQQDRFLRPDVPNERLTGATPSPGDQGFQDGPVLRGHLGDDVRLRRRMIEGCREVGGDMLPEEDLDVAVASLLDQVRARRSLAI